MTRKKSPKRKPVKIGGPKYAVMYKVDGSVMLDADANDRLLLFDSEQEAVDYAADSSENYGNASYGISVLEVIERSVWDIVPEIRHHATKTKSL